MADINDTDLVERRLALQDALVEGERSILHGDVLTHDAAKERMQKWLDRGSRGADSERGKIAVDLIASLDGAAEVGAADAWDIEFCRRIKEIAVGDAELLDVEDVLASVRSRLR